jgi:3-deoxy-D-manno-octulosonic-acid transferase
MSLILYNIFLFFFRIGIGVAAFFNEKAEKWLKGREKIFQRLAQSIPNGEKIIWMHCASLGEFEQGRPVIEKLKTTYPPYKILLTFFSPSGYEVRKNYEQADYIFYLPADSASNAKQFLDIVNPSLVVFVKYEFWYHYTSSINKRNIPFLLISAVFRKNQPFFQWYGSLYRSMLNHFTQVFVQDMESEKLLDKLGHSQKVTVAGDTRFDRVAEIADRFEPIPLIEQLYKNEKIIVAGSTWPGDEKMLAQLMEKIKDPSIRLVIAPHEINTEHLNQIKEFFPAAIFYSQLPTPDSTLAAPDSPLPSQPPILIIDSIGLLSRLYKYAYITYIGGGFTKDGIHNALEAAVFGKPVLFGPNYKKYREAIQLIETEGAKSYVTIAELEQIVFTLINDKDDYLQKCNAAKNYVQVNKGATGKIISYIQEKRLLTN